MKGGHISLFIIILLVNVSIITPSILGVTQQCQPAQTKEEHPTTGSYYAVIAACTQYQNSSYNIPKTHSYSHKTLMRFYDGLLQGKNWQQDHIILLLNNNATKNNIVTALHTMAATLGPDDVFVFEWCGHGTSVPDTNGDEGNDTTDAAICPYDTYKNDQGQKFNVITDDELGSLFSNITCKAQVLIFDCCLSGSMVDNVSQDNLLSPDQTPWTCQGPNSFDVNGPNRIVIMSTPPGCIERGSYLFGFPLNTALGVACQQLTHRQGTTVSAEELFTVAKPLFTAESAFFWVGWWFLYTALFHAFIPLPVLPAIISSAECIFAYIMVQIYEQQTNGDFMKNNANICDEYPGELPLLQT